MTDSTDFILGPQLATGDWFDTTLIAKARQHGEACPAVPPQKPTSPVEPRTEDFAGPNEYRAAVDTWTKQPAVVAWLNDLNSYELLNYYDLAASEYTAYVRSGDSAFLALGDKCADSWAKHPNWIDEGRKRPWIGGWDTYANGVKKWRDENAAPPPRHSGIIGLTVRAIRGRPEFWDYINTYTRFFFDLYIKRNLTQPLYNLREGAFSFRFAVILSQVLPDSFPLQNGGTETNGAALRAQYLADVEAAAVQYYGRSQRADGAYPWNDDFIESDGGSLVGVTQPFIAGILHRALCDAHQVVITPSVKESIKNQILNGCRQLYSGGPYIKDQIEVNSGKRIRGFHYYYHGGTSVNPTRYANGDIKFPWVAAEAWWLPSTRQAISTILGSFGYAYQISGDPFFRDAGNEMYDAAYGGSDGVRAMMDDTAKNFNQHVLGSSSYKAWLGGEVQPPPLPPPTIPVPDESPDGFKGVRVVDSERAVWTIGPARQTLRNGTQAGGGEGSIYKYLTKTVYVLGTDANWYKWGGASWSFVGAQEPGVTIPVPEPPLPPPPPTPPQPPQPTTTRTVSWPKQGSKQNPILNAQWAEKFRLKSVSDTSAVFEKVQ